MNQTKTCRSLSLNTSRFEPTTFQILFIKHQNCSPYSDFSCYFLLSVIHCKISKLLYNPRLFKAEYAETTSEIWEWISNFCVLWAILKGLWVRILVALNLGTFEITRRRNQWNNLDCRGRRHPRGRRQRSRLFRPTKCRPDELSSLDRKLTKEHLWKGRTMKISNLTRLIWSTFCFQTWANASKSDSKKSFSLC